MEQSLGEGKTRLIQLNFFSRGSASTTPSTVAKHTSQNTILGNRSALEAYAIATNDVGIENAATFQKDTFAKSEQTSENVLVAQIVSTANMIRALCVWC